VVAITRPSSQIFLSGDPPGTREQTDFSPALRGLVHRLSCFPGGSPAKQQLQLGSERICNPRAHVTTRHPMPIRLGKND
jgi:hypothetical protein